MRLQRLDLRRFRNLASVEIEPHPRFNVLWGDNGQGKTNLLAGIFWLASLRPLRTTRLRELVSWDAPESASGARVAAEVEHERLVHRLQVRVERGQRVALREGKVVKAADYFGALAVVLFTPEDVGLVRGGPGDRRRFIDRAIFTGRPGHLADVQAYRRALSSRNTLLKQSASIDLVAAYEGPLAARGGQVMAARRSYVERLAPCFRQSFEAVFGGALSAELTYRPSVPWAPGHAPEAALLASLQEDQERDARRGQTHRGPHADDLELQLQIADERRSARAFASQGQKRALVLALKIAEVQLLAETLDRRPVLLLDDVSSELDERRNEGLFRFLNGFRGQVFITTTDPRWLRIEAERRTWRVNGGQLAQE